MNRQIEPVSSAALPANAASVAIGHPTMMRTLANNSLLLIVIPLVILLTGALASYAVYDELMRRADYAWRQGAQSETDRLNVALADALRTTQAPLRAITGLFLGSESVTKAEFDRAVVALAGNDLAASNISVAHLLADAGGTYRMPYGTGLERYGKSGRDPSTWSGLASVADQASQQPQHMLLSAEPIFRDAIGPRFALVVALQGGKHPPLLVAPLDLEEILATFVAEKVPTGLHLAVAHRAMISGDLFPVTYRPLPGDGTAAISQQSISPRPFERRLVFADAEWQLTWTPAPNFQGGPNRNLANTVLIGGLFFSILCACLFLLARHEIKRERALSAGAKQAADMFRRHVVELSLARDAAEQASHAKSQFLANMSHELRTPLNAIIGFSDMMQLGICGPIEDQRQRDCVKHINDSGAHLLHLISDLLDTAKIESGQVELREEALDAVTLAREAIAFLQPTANTKRIRLTLDAGPDLPAWLVDRRAALQILGNLLTNAVKFSQRDSAVFLRLHRTPEDGLMIAVRDHGPGIKAEVLPRIFERFSRGDPMVSGKEEGLGLGLWIVRNLVEMHRGDISVESVVGSGTTVQMHFPPPFVTRVAMDPATIPAD